MARSRRRSSRGKNAGQVGAIVVLVVGIGAVIAFLGWLVIAGEQGREHLDPETLCPQDGPFSQTIVLVDTTDAIGEVTRSEVLTRLDDVAGSIEKGGLLQVEALNQDPTRLQDILRICNPGTGADLNALIANPEKAKKRWAERFDGPVGEKLEEALSGTAQDASPLMAAIQEIAARTLTSDAQKAVSTRIIVVSDMLEHTQYYSHFRDGFSFGNYMTKAGTRYFTNLAGADVEFWMVQRDRPEIDTTALGAFWLHWTEVSHGRGSVSRLMGMN